MSQLAVPVNKKDHIQGAARAPVTLIEYGDYQCPFCGQAYVILKKLQMDMKGTFRLVFRNFPLSQIHSRALPAALAAEAAGRQKKFWEMHDLLYEYQEALEDRDLIGYAYELGLHIDRFVTDMESDAVLQKVHNDFWSGIRSGVNGTPTFFINDRRHDASYSYQELRAAITAAAGVGAKV